MQKSTHHTFILTSLTLVSLVAAAPAISATFTVNALTDAPDANTADGQCATAGATPGACTLRAAVMQANATPGTDIIQLAAAPITAPYRLSIRGVAVGPWGGEPNDFEGDLDITESLTIRGVGTDAAQSVIDAGGAAGLLDRVFEIRPAFGPTAGLPIDVVFENFTITGGNVPQDNYGGGGVLVYNVVNGPAVAPAPKLTLRNMVLEKNFANATGSGLSSFDGDVLIEDSVIRENTSSYVPNNTTGINPGDPRGRLVGGGAGGGLAAWGGPMTVRRSLIDRNMSQVGGGIYTQDASATPTKVLIEDSVISANQGFLGGGIFSMARGTFDLSSGPGAQYGMTLNRVTMETNIAEFAGGAIYNVGSTLLTNAIISSNQAMDVPGNPVYNNKGGGIYNSGRVLHIVGTTIAGNEAQEPRPAVPAPDANSATGGDEIFLDHLNGTSSQQNAARFSFTIQNTIIGDGPPAPPDSGAGIDDNCNGPAGYAAFITSLGNNIDSGNTCFVAAVVAAQDFVVNSLQPSDIVAPAAVGLGPLVDNGSRATVAGGAIIKSRALLAGSPAIGAGAGCPGSDGRGFARVGACDVGSFQINVDQTRAGNAAPAPVADLISTTAGVPVSINVLFNDRDPDAVGTLSLVANSVTTPTNGTVSVAGAAVTYTPRVSFGATAVAEDTFSYTVSDGAATGTGTATVVVYPPGTNNPPTPVPDSVTVGLNVIASLDVLANDSPGDISNPTADRGDVLRLVSANLTSQNAGGLRVSGSSVVFTPNGGFTGEAAFSYVVADNRGGQATGDGKITVVANATTNPPAANKPPEVQPGGLTLSVAPGNPVQRQINAIDPEGAALRYSVLKAATQGAVTFDPVQVHVVTYKANTTATVGSTDTFTVGVSDGTLTTNVDFTVTIVAQSTPGTGTQPPPGSGQLPTPVAQTVTLNGATGKASGKLSATNITTGNSISFVKASDPANGTVVINGATGDFTYTVNSTTATSDSFGFVVETGSGSGSQKSAPATVTINFPTNTNAAPAPAAGTGDSGGGALDPAWLALLLIPMLRRRRG